jgi:hypothetical protein
MRVGLTFDDVLLVPKFSDMKSRKGTGFMRIASAGHKDSLPYDIRKVV